jgi:hypothetical protein
MLNCFLLFSCHSKKVPFQNGDNTAIQRIEWKLQKDFDIKDLVENINYILLEDKVEALFSSIDKLIIENNRIYILDISGTKSLLVFDITGKFLHKVGSMGGGPNEYTRYINFDVHDNIVYIYDNSKRKMLIYDEDGKYRESMKSSFSFYDFYVLESKKYLLSLDIHEENNSNNKIIVTNDLKEGEIAYFSFPKDFKNSKMNVRSFQPFHKKLVYMLPVSDTLFILNEQGNVENGYFFDFGNRKLPNKLKNDYEETVKQRQGNDYIYIYNTPIRIKQYVFADLFVGNQKYLAVFDIQKNELAYELMTPANFQIKNINFPLYAMNDSILVSYINYPMYEAVKDKILLDSKTIEHLSNDGVALCLYKIND